MSMGFSVCLIVAFSHAAATDVLIRVNKFSEFR
jgi:hypothetical protein